MGGKWKFHRLQIFAIILEHFSLKGLADFALTVPFRRHPRRWRNHYSRFPSRPSRIKTYFPFLILFRWKLAQFSVDFIPMTRIRRRLSCCRASTHRKSASVAFARIEKALSFSQFAIQIVIKSLSQFANRKQIKLEAIKVFNPESPNRRESVMRLRRAAVGKCAIEEKRWKFGF